MSDFYFNMLDRSDQQIYTRALHGVKNYKCNIRIGKISDDSFLKIIYKILYDHPELFYVDFSRILTTYDSIRGLTWNVRYRFPSGTIKQKTKEMEDKISQIISRSGLTEKSTTVEKCRWIHDTIVRNVEYDHRALQDPSAYPEAYTIQGVFENRRSVCQGISLAVIALGDRLGLETGFVSGKGNSELPEFNDNHGWNMVHVDGGYTHMDVTWDMCLSRQLRSTRYDYFLVPDNEIKIDHIMDEPLMRAAATGYSFFEQTGRDFTTRKQCSDYISSVLANKKNIFYFRFRMEGETPEQSDAKLQSMIMRKAILRFLQGLALESCHNLDQKIFYYRIKGF